MQLCKSDESSEVAKFKKIIGDELKIHGEDKLIEKFLDDISKKYDNFMLKTLASGIINKQEKEIGTVKGAFNIFKNNETVISHQQLVDENKTNIQYQPEAEASDSITAPGFSQGKHNETQHEIAKQDLLNHFNENFLKTRDLNDKFVNYVDENGRNFAKFYVVPEEFYKMTSDPFIKEFINKHTKSQVMQFIRIKENFKEKMYQILEAKFKVNLEMMFNPPIMNNYVSKKVQLHSLKSYFIKQFQNNSVLIDKFIEFLDHEIERADEVDKFRVLRENLENFKNPLMEKFIKNYKDDQVMDVMKSISDDRIPLNETDTCKIDALMMFDKEHMKHILLRCLLKNNLNRRFSDASKVNEKFLDYLDDMKICNLTLYDVEPEEFYRLDQDKIMIHFVEKYEGERIKDVLDLIISPEEAKISLYNERINIEMMFNTDILKNYLSRKLNIMELESTMKRQFSDIPKFIKKFIDYIQNSNVDPKKYNLKADDFFKLKNDVALARFVKDNRVQQMKDELNRLNPRFAESDFKIMEKRGIVDSINIEMLFRPSRLKSFLVNVYINDCKTGFAKILMSQPEEWGRTPDKCIIDPICTKLKLRYDNEIKAEVDKFPIATRTFDEVDEMIFDMTRDEVEKRQLIFDGDVDCLVAYMKRRNIGNSKWYDIELLTDDRKRKEKLNNLIREFKYNRM